MQYNDTMEIKELLTQTVSLLTDIKNLLKEEKTNLQVTKNFNISEMEYYDKVPELLLENAKQTMDYWVI